MSQLFPLPRVVSFSCEGFTLYGSLHAAEGPSRDIGMILFNQGPLERAGAHRLSIQIARRWAKQGLPVFRVDARGVGDSEGDWSVPPDGAPIRMLYKQVEEGAWTADAHAAIDCLVRETGVRHVVLGGLCGGAITALHAATHPAVCGVVMVAMPVRPQSEVVGAGDLVDSKVKEEAKDYVAKVFAPDAWKRFLTMQTDYGTLWSVMATRLHRLVGGGAPDAGMNVPLLRSFVAASKAKRRLLFVYPDHDYLWTEFEELFQTRYPQAECGYELRTIANANHTFTESDWQAELYATLEAWSQGLSAREAGA
jgi:dienelactone hydrolase